MTRLRRWKFSPFRHHNGAWRGSAEIGNCNESNSDCLIAWISSIEGGGVISTKNASLRRSDAAIPSGFARFLDCPATRVAKTGSHCEIFCLVRRDAPRRGRQGSVAIVQRCFVFASTFSPFCRVVCRPEDPVYRGRIGFVGWRRHAGRAIAGELLSL